MRIKRLRRAFCLLFSLLLAGSLCLPAAGAALPADRDWERISIRSAEDLVRFAESYSYDAWSRNKYVVLERDISLGGVDYLPAASFSGVFDGGGHTISGLSLTAEVSPAGLFGCLESGSRVMNLTVTGSVTPQGEGRQVGGIAGINRGTVSDCVFSGSVRGEDMTGGIVGENRSEGVLRRCLVTGGVFGMRMTGGVAGASSGTVSACANRAYVNTDTVDPGISLSDLNLDLEDSLRRLASPDTYHVATDSGGIAGFSDGVLSACRNYGTVGYQHVGYNVGGIAGRSSGLASGCVNYGQVYGRKDVGGVAGIAEPYVVIRITEGTLDTVREELNTLSALVDRAAADAAGSSATVSARLSALGGSVDTARNRAGDLGTDLAKTADGAAEEVNRTAGILTGTLPLIADAASDMETASAELSEGLSGMDSAMGNTGGEAIGASVRELRAAADVTDRGLALLSQGLGGLRGTIGPGEGMSRDEWEQLIYGDGGAMDALSGGISALAGGLLGLRNALDGLESAMEQGEITTPRQVRDYLTQAGVEESLRTAAEAVPEIGRGLETIAANSDFSDQAARQSLDTARRGLELISGSGGGNGTFDHLRAALAELDRAGAESEEGFDELRQSIALLSKAAGAMTDSLTDLGRLTDYLRNQETPALPALGAGTEDSAQALREALGQVSGQLEQLNGELSGASEQLTGDVRRINGQFQALMETLLGAVEDAENASVTAVVEDVSDEDVDGAVSGKLLRCVNEGTVSGDINVGGVAGSMSVYDALNPEGDGALSLSASIHRTYQLKCILQDCRNGGTVTGKRNNVGAVCGDAGLGVVSGCLGYGSAESLEGGYVGGIAGRADNILRRCWARCALSGSSRVGGIVGAAPEEDTRLLVADCVSLVDLQSQGPYTGAVSGAAAGSFSGNRFVSDSLGGVNRVSLEGQAEPIGYDELLALDDLPRAYRSFTLSFVAGDETVERLRFSYGDSFGPETFPAIPARDGYYAVWDRQELDHLHLDTVVTAVYAPCVTALASDVTRSDARPICFVLGAFADGETLELSPAMLDFRPERNGLWDTLRAYRRTLVEQWELTVPADGASEHTFHYLPSRTLSGAPELYVSDGSGTWTRPETESFGSYLSFTAPGETLYLSVLTAYTPWWVWAITGAFVLALLALLVTLLIRRRVRKETGEDEKARAQRFRRIRRRARLVMLLAAIGIGAAAALVLRFAPEIRSVETAMLLQNYAERTEMALNLSVCIRNGSELHGADFSLRSTDCGGKRVTKTDLYRTELYRCGETCLLSDGSAFRAVGCFPDEQVLLNAAAELYRQTEVTVTQRNEEKTTHAQVSGSEAAEVLTAFLPGLESAGLSVDSLTVDLTVAEGQPTELSASWTGPDTQVDALLRPDPVPDKLTLPQAVAEAVSTGVSVPEDGAAEHTSLLLAWLELVTRDPLNVRFTRNVSCGPVLEAESALWQRSYWQGSAFDALTREGDVQYAAGGDAVHADGSPVAGGAPALTDVEGLLNLALEAALRGEGTAGGADETVRSLDETAMAALGETLSSEASELSPSWREGTLTLTVSEGQVKGLSLQITGTVSVAGSNVSAQAGAVLRFPADEHAPELPAPAAAALGLA